MVIFYHQWEAGGCNNWVFANLNSYLATPVSIFALLLGYFLVNNEKTSYGILPLSFFYYILNLLIVVITLQFNNFQDFYSIKEAILYGGRYWWYIWTIPLVYLIAPAINIAIKTFNWKNTLSIIIIIYLLNFFFTNGDLENTVYEAKQFLFLALIYSSGAWWKQNEHLIQEHKKIFLLLA